MENDLNKVTSNERIRQLLTDLGVSQVEFCTKTGVKPSALSNYLKGNRVPRQDALSKIADAYGISPTWLMGYDVPKDMKLRTLVIRNDNSEYFEIFAPVGRYEEYTELINAAEYCTYDQIWVAINMLREFEKMNLKEEEDKQ